MVRGICPTQHSGVQFKYSTEEDWMLEDKTGWDKQQLDESSGWHNLAVQDKTICGRTVPDSKDKYRLFYAKNYDGDMIT